MTNICVSVLAMCVLCHQQPVGVSVYVGRIYWCFSYNMSLKRLFISRFSPRQVIFFLQDEGVHSLSPFILDA